MTLDRQFKQRNLPEQVADYIVAGIAKGELRAGQRLIEVDLCDKLGVSRIPLREALRILQAQGVVRTIPNRGSFVNQLSAEETAEILEIRLSIERTALRRLLKRVPTEPAIVMELQGRLEDLRRAARVRDQLTYCQADLAFHQCIVDLSGSPLLQATWNSLARGVLFFLMQEREVKFDYREQLRDHQRLVDLIQAVDGAELESEIGSHIRKNLERFPTRMLDPNSAD
ncbi:MULTISPECIES: GntR family transcriptional regulator [unclassified Caballeronia]|jgi:DNA-binding GntR family transcriptional regulator|uniref:GntR family transcriptional regulator n=1 Tax=unclassified Caballeronia TaxID=2646786 RepID=UPI00202896A4|nr:MULTISPECIES: GntR family transcriptional regulator [unclassified Caballeronia]